VYVLDASNKAQTRDVTTGPLQDDGLRVIEQGLKPDDLVVVGALQQVRAGDLVKPLPAPMPSFGPTSPPDREGAPIQKLKPSSGDASKAATRARGESNSPGPASPEPKKS
jgi:hypothetical protein